MSLVDIQRGTFNYYPHPPFAGTPATASALLNAAGMKAAFVFPCGSWKGALTIDSVEFLVGTVSADGAVDVRVETVDATTGFPTGTLFAANTNVAKNIVAADANKIVRATLTADAEVDANPFAVVIAWTSGSCSIQTRLGLYTCKVPYCANHNGTAWSDSVGYMIIGLRESGGIEPHKPQPGCLLFQTITQQDINTGTTPDELGDRILIPQPVGIDGLWWYGHPAGDYDAIIYNDADEILASKSVESNMVSGTGQGLNHVYFNTPVHIPKDTPFRAVIKPTSGSNVTLWEFDAVLPERLDTWEGGGYASDGIICTSRTNDGAWTNVSSKRILMGLLLGQLDAGGVATSYARLVNGL